MNSKPDHLAALIALTAEIGNDPVSHIACYEIESIVDTTNGKIFVEKIKEISQRLPCEIENWIVPEAQNSNGYGINVHSGLQLFSNGDLGRAPSIYSEANGVVDFVYDIYKVIFPTFTVQAANANTTLDSLDLDTDRYYWWLKYASEVFYMYQVNRYYGLKSLANYRRWASEELARREIISSPSVDDYNPDDRKQKMNLIRKYMAHSLQIAGFTNETANYLIWKNYF